VSDAIDLRVALRPFGPEDAALVEPWLAEAVAAVEGARPTASASLTLDGLEAFIAGQWPGAELAAIVGHDDAPLGFVAWRTKPSVAPVEIEIVAIAVGATHRNLGLGGEAVEALERLRPGGRFLAAIPRGNGLAVYFWLRTGYRPVRPDEDDARVRDPDVLWMVRSEMEEITGAPPGP
jgi:hypothetical protein